MFDTGYKVRDAENHEVFRLTEICESVLQESTTYRHMEFSREKTANFIMDGILKRPNTFLRIIVDEDNKPVGGIMCIIEDCPFGPHKQAYDVTVMIDKEHRGKCLPQLVQIINEYKAWATAEGAKIIKLGISSGLNIDKASDFLERMGFAHIGSSHGYHVGA